MAMSCVILALSIWRKEGEDSPLESLGATRGMSS